MPPRLASRQRKEEMIKTTLSIYSFFFFKFDASKTSDVTKENSTPSRPRDDITILRRQPLQSHFRSPRPQSEIIQSQLSSFHFETEDMKEEPKSKVKMTEKRLLDILCVVEN